MKLSIRKPADVIAGGLFLLVGIVGVVWSSAYPLGTAMRMGAGYFPSLVGAVLAILGIAVAVRGLGWSAVREPRRASRANWRPALFIGGGVVTFALSVPVLGLLLATMLMTLVSGFARPKARLGELLGISLALAGFGVLVFAYGLDLHLPVLPV